MVQTAQAQGQFLKMACLNKTDQYFGSIQNDGTSTRNWFGAHQALGNSVDPGADTPVQRLQRYYARYLVARWGAYPAVHSLEYTNEMDDYDGVEYAGAQAFATPSTPSPETARRRAKSSAPLHRPQQRRADV